MFIAFEGGEGVGKSSQIKLLEKALKGMKFDVTSTREPQKEIEKIIPRDNIPSIMPILETLSFLIDRILHIEDVIKPNLAQGKIVLCDRFSYSTIAYQGYGRLVDIDIIERLNAQITKDCRPDIVFLLDMPAEESLKRIKPSDKFENESLDFHKRVRSGYLEIAKKEKIIKVINGTKSKSEIHKIIMEEIERLL